MKRAICQCLGYAALLGAMTWAQAADLTVSAAASLTNAFTEIGAAFGRASQGRHKVVFNFGASGALLQQILRGAPVDVFASADLDSMDRAAQQGLIVEDSRRNFLQNKLVVAVPVRTALSLRTLADLRSAQVSRIALGIPESVPVGRYAKGVLQSAGLWEALAAKVIYGQSVRQCLDYVARGEVDAAFVYATDVQLMGSRVMTAFEVPTRSPILYPIAVVKGNGQESAAREFVQYVLSKEARTILTKHGFLMP